LARVPAGFPSPAEDYIDRQLDLNEFIEHPATTFFFRLEAAMRRRSVVDDCARGGPRLRKALARQSQFDPVLQRNTPITGLWPNDFPCTDIMVKLSLVNSSANSY